MSACILSSILAFAGIVPQQAPTPAQTVAGRQTSASELPSRGLLRTSESAAPGYTLVAPLSSSDTHLVDLAGNVVHSWRSDSPPGSAAYLLESGHLLRTERMPNPRFTGGGQGGRIREFDWDGSLLWEYELSDDKRCLHHDVEWMPNGNVLAIAWESLSPEQVAATGRVDSLESFRPDCVLEIEPVRPVGGRIVWEWRALDHLIQDRDPQLANHGDPGKHPGRIDVNALGTTRAPGADPAELDHLRRLGYVGAEEPAPSTARTARPMENDWLHLNGIDHRADLDLIVLSVHNLNEIWVIDHSTTTAEAAGSKGGRYGKGGDLLLRWGNPQTHRAGPPNEQLLWGQHDAQWIPSGLQGAGHVLLFNNGGRDAWAGDSIVDEIALPLDPESLKQPMDVRALAALTPVWSYTSPEISSVRISGVQRLARGNTLICVGQIGRLVEVDARGAVVWEWLNPFTGTLLKDGSIAPGARAAPQRPGGDTDSGIGEWPRGQATANEHPDAPGGPGHGYGLFRADRYAPDYPGVAALVEKTAQPR